jgi:hypothetical protein
MPKIERTVRLNPDAVREAISTAEHQADAWVAMYRMVFPEWDRLKSIHDYPVVNKTTGKKLMRLFIDLDKRLHPKVLAGGMWMNSGWSSLPTDDELDTWEVRVDVEVTFVGSGDGS